MTERALTAGMITEVQTTPLRPILFFEGEFVSGGSPAWLRLWTGYGTIAWNGQSWLGAGDLIAVAPLSETTEIRAEGFAVTLSGQPSANISLALQSMKQGRSGKIWLGALDASNAIIADPYLVRAGRLDVPKISDAGDSCSITVQYEDRLIDLERPRERRYTHEDQQIDYPGDLGFEYVASLQEASDIWKPQGAA